MVKSLNLNEFWGKKILITGGLGFVGGNLVSTMLNHDLEPIILDYIPEGLTVDNRYIPFNRQDVEFYNVDLRNRKSVLEVVNNITPDYVIHLASMTDLTKDFNSAFLSVEINIKGTLHLLESVSKLSLENFLFMSTSDVYGGVQSPFHENQTIIPASPYSVSKTSAEMYSLMFNRVLELPVTILRSFNLFGKYQKENRVLPYIIMRLLKGQPVELTGGKQKREFNYVENLIDAIFLALKTPESHGKVINIGTGESISIREIALKVARRFNRVEKLRFGAVPYRPNEIWDMYCDNTRARTILGWSPRIDLDKGLDHTIKWFQDTFTQ
ncbi:MAG: GDP-mannose 4,6-dehydratase [Candidatus Heimdallarchaeota archaeon]|nr:MAG: GDP-mannose 4,6-dehydratase [Candidatus Heimdallarchaeota archaeon]